jgi:hypothetical protein
MILPCNLLISIVLPSLVLQVKTGALSPILVKVVVSVCADAIAIAIKHANNESNSFFIFKLLGTNV